MAIHFRKLRLFVLSLTTSMFGVPIDGAYAQESAGPIRFCGTTVTNQTHRVLDDIGGRHITSRGTLRALIVFASFPDDSTPHPYWPPHQPPLFMQQFIDPDTMIRSQGSFNLTNYFSQMSLGQFNLVGDAIWVESAHSQEEYRQGAYGRANKHLLQERVDPLVDFSQYDRWKRNGDFIHSNVPDSIVDMIVMVWRTDMFEFVGEASLGYWPAFQADGKRIEMGFPEYLPYPRGSGVTCEFLYGDTPRLLLQVMAHELSHWLLGGPHPYNSEAPQGKLGFWGMLCGSQRASSCANAYDRERLGWITVLEIQSNVNIALTDYLTTGAAYKFHPPNGESNEFFYIENHQLLSVFDDVTTNATDKGLWILHQEGPYLELNNLRMKPSDGSWRWRNPGTTTQCSSQPLPVFEKGTPYPQGLSHRDQIPNATSALNWLQAFRDPSGAILCGRLYGGDQFDGTFDLGNPVFSPYSNPNTNTWSNQQTGFSVEILGQSNGALTIRYNSNVLDGSPARRYLGLDPTIPTPPPGVAFLAWGAQWLEGQPLEVDVTWSELQRQVAGGGNWETVYQGPLTTWSDSSVTYDSSGTIPVTFRARVRDAQGKFSSWSNRHHARILPPNSIDPQIKTVLPVRIFLGDNYPNPFNASTTIEYHLPRSSHVRLKVYDVLGREVTTLVDDVEAAGRKLVTLNGTSISSGVYYYRLETGSFIQSKKATLLR